MLCTLLEFLAKENNKKVAPDMTQNICMKRKSTKWIWNNVLILNKKLILISIDFFLSFLMDAYLHQNQPTKKPLKIQTKNTMKKNNTHFKV